MNNEDLLKRYKTALEGLTVGGSEYYNDPEKCARDIQYQIDNKNEYIKMLIKERKKIYAMPIIGWIIKLIRSR